MSTLTFTNNFATTSSNDFLPLGVSFTELATTYQTSLTVGGVQKILTFTGVGFTYSLGNLTGGTIQTVTLTEGVSIPTQQTRYTWTGLSASAADFAAATTAAGKYRVLAVAADTMLGGTQQDLLQSGRLNDSLSAGAGNDFLIPGPGLDTVNGGDGNDWLMYQDVLDPSAYAGLTATALIMTLGAGGAGTVVDPWGFTDTYSGIERVRGTAFNDSIIGNAADNFLAGLAGLDTLDGGDGIDTVTYEPDATFNGALGVTVNLLTGTATDGFGQTDTLRNIEGARGTTANDVFTGGNLGLGANNAYEFYGFGGNDVFNGGDGGMYVEPGAGDDTINGGPNSNSVYQISYSDHTGANGVTINLSAATINDPFGGVDTISNVNGARGTKNADTILGSAAENNFIRGLGGADSLDGGAGLRDLVAYDRDVGQGGVNGIFALFGANPGDQGTVVDGFGTTDTIRNFEFIRGTEALTSALNPQNQPIFPGFGDVIITDGAANLIDARGGMDYVDAKGGDDTVFGGESGAAGSVDWLIGGDGVDMLDFGQELGTGGVYIAQGASSLSRDTYGGYDVFFGFETIRGTNNTFVGLEAWSDLMFGDASNTTFLGRGGADYIDAGGGADLLDGGDGADFLLGSGGADTIVGGLGNDYMYDSGGATTYDLTGAALRAADFDIIIAFDADDVLTVSAAAQSSLSFFTIGDKHYLSAAVTGAAYTLEFQFSSQTLAQIQSQITFI